MKCRFCHGGTRVLSTRCREHEFYKVRRVQCTLDPTHRFNTVEVLESLLKKIATSRVDALLRQNSRGAERMRRANERKLRVLELFHTGIKYSAIGAEVGVGEDQVRKIVKKAGLAPPPGRRPRVRA